MRKIFRVFNLTILNEDSFVQLLNHIPPSYIVWSAGQDGHNMPFWTSSP